MSMPKSLHVLELIRIGVRAGIAGGLAEVAWIATYGAYTGATTGPIARGIVATVFPFWTKTVWSAPLGIVIHMILAVALGVGLALLTRVGWRGPSWGLSDFGLVTSVLAAVWAVNFFAALPHLNPSFVRLLPYSVTLVSKRLFAVSAAMVLRAQRLRVQRVLG